MTVRDDSRLKCSFCTKTQERVKKLISGPDVYICDECIELCNEILNENSRSFKNITEHGSSRLKCSFCGKTQEQVEKLIPRVQVKKLIAGPDVYICNECVKMCNEILDEESSNE